MSIAYNTKADIFFLNLPLNTSRKLVFFEGSWVHTCDAIALTQSVLRHMDTDMMTHHKERGSQRLVNKFWCLAEIKKLVYSEK